MEHDRIRTAPTATPRPQRAPTTRQSPGAPGLLALQRSAGNAATTAFVQRQLLEQERTEWIVDEPMRVGEIELRGGERVREVPGSLPPMRTVELLAPHPQAGRELLLPSGSLRSTRVTPSGRSTHEWRTALQNARNDLLHGMEISKQEFHRRHVTALRAFESTMSFAKRQPAAASS